MSSSGEGDRPTFFVIMPARNTESMIGTVLRSLSDDVWANVGELVVLDNASRDGTVAAANEFLASRPDLANKMRVLENGVDLGYGGSVQRGLQLAVDSHCTHALIMHSDDQGNWDAIVRRLMYTAAGPDAPDVVLACRFLRGADLSSYSVTRKAGNMFFNVYTRAVTGLRMPDPGTAIIAVKRDVLAKLPLDQLDSGFHFHPQLNILFYEDDALAKTETTLDWRDASEDNHFELFRYGMTLLRMLTRYGWERRVKRAEPQVALQALVRT